MRFIIITVAPEPLLSELETVRRRVNAEIGTHEALRYPAHVTLRTGIVCPDADAKRVSQDFEAHVKKAWTLPARIVSKDLRAEMYESEGGERGLLGWRIAAEPGLIALHSALLGYSAYQKGPQRAFHPHLTLAFHDVDVRALRRAETMAREARLHEMAFSWDIIRVSLYVEAPDGWTEYTSFSHGFPT